MRRRLHESFGAAVMVTVLVALLPLAQATLDAQAPAAARTAAASSAAPKTAWGHPDIQGIWLDEFQTPLERSTELGDREFFTAEERAKQDAARSGNEGRNRRAETGSRQDVAGAYNAVFTSAKPAGRRTSLVVEPANGRIPALTTEARRQDEIEREFRMALLQNTETCKTGASGCAGWQYGPPSPRRAEVPPFYNTGRLSRHNGPEDQSMGDRCMSGVTPDLNGFKRIVQGPDSIALAIDTGQGQGYQRVVYLSGSHPPSHIRLRHGDSRGRWEGNTLVVETTNFSPKHDFRGASVNLKLVERFTRVDADTLEYAVTVTDPTVWTAPWSGEYTWPTTDDRIYEYACHEGNYALGGIMRGARTLEADVIKARAEK